MSMYLLDTPQLFQWDLNRKIKILGKGNIDEVHFCHAGDEEALIVSVKKENNALIANIPNILLQSCEELMVYLVENGKTIKEGFFVVNNREKPSEYIYEETEVLNYAALEKRLQKLEEDLKNIGADSMLSADDAIDLVSELRLAIPLTNKESVIYTNENGNVIYTL